MAASCVDDDASSTDATVALARTGATFVLIGGEAHITQGVEPRNRELLHTSLSFIAEAYDRLRKSGVPAKQIITIVQARDYIDGLEECARLAALRGNPHNMPCYAEQYQRVRADALAAAKTLLDEGGPTYDGPMVNTSTIWAVLLGLRSEKTPVVVDPERSAPLCFSIYSHGDSHPVKPDPAASSTTSTRSQDLFHTPEQPKDPLKTEWFAHMPYPNTDRPELLDFVAHEAGTHPTCYFYATQLRALLVQLFAAKPDRPVVGLLNYCRSGGNLHFMRMPIASNYYGASRWPLYLMSSSSGHQDSLVGGLWNEFFTALASILSLSSPSSSATSGADLSKLTFDEFFALVECNFRKNYLFELLDQVKTYAYPALGQQLGGEKDSFHDDLKGLLCAGPRGLPDFKGLKKLQADYKSGKKMGRTVLIRNPRNWSEVVDLPTQVRKALASIALPEEVHGEGIAQVPVARLFSRI